jgi:spore maturation protein SpmB
MFIQLAVATMMVLVTVGIHGLGLLGLSRLLGLESREERAAHISPLSVRGLLSTLGLVLGVFTLHGIEIWLYALLFLLLGALPDLETSVYFSTITYGTVGYNDHGIAHSWRLVAAIEGINGVLLLGWTTAFFVSLVARLRWN